MFYKELSRFYNEIFPFDENTYNFLKSYAKGDFPVLDIGCATGVYVNRFLEDGFKAFGVEKETAFELQGPFIYADMLRLPLKSSTKFGFIYSIGNTLVHVNSKLDFYNTVRNVMSLLKERCFFLIQIINYDRIYGYELKGLPDIETEHYMVNRIYHYDNEEQLIFEMKVTDKHTKEVRTLSSKLTPIFLEDVKNAAARAGAGFVQFFGDFQGGKFFLKDSMMLIAAIYK
ncbi:class I SAM-dependent methyltransferase [Deferribacter autotrophicus]|uniref:Class I SAM-dependent methyltransferase n=1 Tax=Deferribacter autotrophicus TaxID=500465 RepID=A0A5A8F8F7_9BACT|nr:class I SAM-dependent methyltransferase [Deferribacter autotrophicus]KAA0258791.1 class I SAM-dependent methyltransferase [Deferribacter autotrophicus]